MSVVTETWRVSLDSYSKHSSATVQSGLTVILVTHVAVNVKVTNQLLQPIRKSVAISVAMSSARIFPDIATDLMYIATDS